MPRTVSANSLAAFCIHAPVPTFADEPARRGQQRPPQPAPERYAAFCGAELCAIDAFYGSEVCTALATLPPAAGDPSGSALVATSTIGGGFAECLLQKFTPDPDMDRGDHYVNRIQRQRLRTMSCQGDVWDVALDRRTAFLAYAGVEMRDLETGAAQRLLRSASSACLSVCPHAAPQRRTLGKTHRRGMHAAALKAPGRLLAPFLFCF